MNTPLPPIKGDFRRLRAGYLRVNDLYNDY